MKNILGKFSYYEIFARYLPSLATSLPFFLFGYFVLHYKETADVVIFILSFKIFGYLTFSFIFIYAYSLFIRSISKYFEKKYFINRQGFPTTYLMLYSDNSYSKAYKDEFRDKVKKIYNFDLCSLDDEKQNYNEAKLRLNDVTKRIILKLGDGKLIGKHNQWYGFIRNIVGGSLIGFICSLINIILGLFIINQLWLVILSIPLIIAYCIIFIFRKFLIIQNAESYAKQLHSEFIMFENVKKNKK